MTTPADIATRARAYIGIPWRHLGRDETGMDCVGLVIRVARDLGLVADRFDVNGYDRRPRPDVLERRLAQHLQASATDPAPGHVVTMRVNRVPFHVGILACGPNGTLRLIHSYITTGQVCEHTLDVRWTRRVSRAYEFPGVTYG